MIPHIDELARQVALNVTGGRTVVAQAPERVTTRELTIEIDSKPYPEVRAAFEEFCRITETAGRLLGYTVRPVVDDGHVGARVTATVEVEDRSFVGRGLSDDVVAGSVQAFATAVAQAR